MCVLDGGWLIITNPVCCDRYFDNRFVCPFCYSPISIAAVLTLISVIFDPFLPILSNRRIDPDVERLLDLSNQLFSIRSNDLFQTLISVYNVHEALLQIT